MTLDQLKIGSTGTITRVTGGGATRLRLLEMGLTPGTAVRVCKTAPMGDPLEISLRGYTLTIRRSQARAVWIGGGGR